METRKEKMDKIREGLQKAREKFQNKELATVFSETASRMSEIIKGKRGWNHAKMVEAEKWLKSNAFYPVETEHNIPNMFVLKFPNSNKEITFTHIPDLDDEDLLKYTGSTLSKKHFDLALKKASEMGDNAKPILDKLDELRNTIDKTHDKLHECYHEFKTICRLLDIDK